MKSGRTFSSASRDVIGKESALGSRDIQNIEGYLPEQRRLNVSEKVDSIQQQGRDVGIEAERYLGSDQLRGIDFGSIANPYAGGRDYSSSNTNLYTPAGGVSGDQILQRKKAEREAANERVKALYL